MPGIPYVGSLYDYSRGPGAGISALLLERGRAQAENAARIGQIWGNTIANLGQIPHQIEQDQYLKESRMAAADERRQRAKLLEEQTQEKQRKEESEKQVGTALEGVGTQGYDFQKALSGVDPAYRQAFSEAYNKIDTARQEADVRKSTIDANKAKLAKDEQDYQEAEAYHLATSAQALKNVMGTPAQDSAMALFSDYYGKHRPDELAKFQQTLGQNPQALPQLLDSLIGQSSKFAEEQKKGLKDKSPQHINIGGVERVWDPDRPNELGAALGPAGNPKEDKTGDMNPQLRLSYNHEDAKLQTIAKPLREQGERFSRLVETINQKTPAADALIAPELLTVMAGGIGSGLRMNEAEIARIVGGRTKWEDLKAAVNKWQIDPSKGLSITDDQRSQIRSLIGNMYERITKRTDLIDKAAQDLVDAKDIPTQRRITATLQGELNKIANPSEGGGKKVTQAQLQAVAAKNGSSIEAERKRAQAEGYTVE